MTFQVENKKTTIQLLDDAPYVLIRREALNKMYHYTDICKDEVGWLGTAYKTEEGYEIVDTFLFDQEVHATTTEITTEGLSAFGEKILTDPTMDGMEVWNNLKMWGHSHVNMSTSPSGQDDLQMKKFAEVGHDFFIRLICNKKGDLRVDVYDYASGVAYLDAQWYVQEPSEVESVLDAIAELEERLEALKTRSLTLVETEIKQEVAEKVKPLKPTITLSNAKKSYTNDKWANYWNIPKGTAMNTSEIAEDYWNTDEDVMADLGDVFLLEMSGLPFKEVENELMLNGFYDVLTEHDIRRVQRVAKLYGGYDYYGTQSY